MKRRHLVVATPVVLSVITFLDRMAIAVTGPAIQRDLSIDPVAWGWVLSAYVLAYSVFEIPSGALGNRHGYRRELTRITLWWSFFTSITALCRGAWQIAGARAGRRAGAAAARAAGGSGRLAAGVRGARCRGPRLGAGLAAVVPRLARRPRGDRCARSRSAISSRARVITIFPSSGSRR